MTGGNWFSDRMEDLGGAWDATGGRIAEALRGFEGIAPAGSGADAAGDAFRNWLADNLVNVAYPSIPGVPSAGTAIDAVGKFQDWWSPPTLQQPNPGAATIWDDASGSWVTGPGRAMPTQSERDAMIDPATGRFVPLLDPNAPGVASKGIPPPPTIGGAAATATAHQLPSLADLYANKDQLARDTALNAFTAKSEYFTSVEAALETKLAELARLQRNGATGAADAVREALATLEATRFARLRNDEAEAKAYLATLEQKRVDREDELSDDVKTRSDEALANYDSIVSGVEGSLGGLSGPPAQSIFGDATRERGLLTSQALSQQDLLSTLAGTYANDAVDRGMRLGAMYDRAGVNLADSLWQQNTQNDLALQQALSNIDIAGAQQDIDLYSQMAPQRFANEQEYDAALADIETGAAARGIAGAEQARLLDLLGPLLGAFEGSPGSAIANEHGTEGLGLIFGAAMQAGIGGTVAGKLMDPTSSGQIKIPIGGQEFTVNEQWYAGKILEMMANPPPPTRTVPLPEGGTITLPVSSFAELQRSAEVVALG